MADKERDRPALTPSGPANPIPSTPKSPEITAILRDRADEQWQARKRLRAQEDHIRICTELDRLAPLARYYSRPLRDVPLGTFLAEGWWAA
jgi:hypothetical protein